MGLEAPLALLGLLAAALPWLAHRIRRRDMPVVALPTLAFLLQAEAAQRRRHNLSDLLLLVARIGLFVALCLALTAPYVTARVTFGDGEVSAAAIVIDDSLSMQREHNGSTLLSRAVDRASEAIAALPGGSEVTVVLAGEPPRTWLDRTDDLDLAATRVRELPPRSDRATALPAAIDLARRKLATSDKRRKRVLVLSDFAAHTQFAEPEGGGAEVQTVYERQAPAPEVGNAHFAGVSSAPDPASPGRWSVSVSLESFGPVPDQVRLRIDGPGDHRASSAVSLQEGHGRAVVFVPDPAADADPRIRLTLDVADALAEDNQYDLLLGEQAAVRVLLVNGDPHPADTRDELRYLSRALALAPPEVLAARVQTVDAALLEHYDLSQTDVVVLANTAPPSAAYVERLGAFVARGGGLVVAAGDHVDAQQYNATMEDLLGVHLSASEKVGSVGLDDQVDGALLPHGLTGLSQARVTRRVRAEGPASVRLRYADGPPALLSHQHGRGRALLWTSTLDADWNDLPLRPGFLALCAGVVRFAAGDRALVTTPSAPGQQARLPIPPGAKLVEVIGPDDVRHRFDHLEASTLVFDATELSGAYRVLLAGQQGIARFSPELSFVVPAPPGESDLRSLDVDGGAVADGGAGSDATQARVRKPLTHWFLLLAAIFGVCETALRTLRPRLGRRR